MSRNMLFAITNSVSMRIPNKKFLCDVHQQIKSKIRYHKIKYVFLIFINLARLAFFNWDSLDAMLTSHYEAWCYKEKKKKKIKSIKQAVWKQAKDKRCILILHFKPFRY